MAIHNRSMSAAARLEYLDDRIGYAEFEIERNRKWARLHNEMAEEKQERAEQWKEEKERCEGERMDVIASLRQSA